MSMRLWEKVTNLQLFGKLRINRNGTIVVQNTDLTETVLNTASLVRSGAKFTTGVTTTTFAAGQLTGSNKVVYENTQATPGTITTRTASLMFTDDLAARVGLAYSLRISNNNGTGILTVAAGVGVTLTGTATIAINTFRDFVVTYTSATALVIQQIGSGTA